MRRAVSGMQTKNRIESIYQVVGQGDNSGIIRKGHEIYQVENAPRIARYKFGLGLLKWLLAELRSFASP